MTTLTALIARVEAATEGSRELSSLVWCVAVRGYEISADGKQFCVPQCYCCQGHRDGEPHWQPIVAPGFSPPDYSTSLDAALTLVQREARIVIDISADGATVTEIYTPRRHSGEGMSPPLATCAAALRAIRHEREPDA